MPSNNEIKQMTVEIVIPFFEGGGLKDILYRLEALETINVLKAMPVAKEEKAKATEKTIREREIHPEAALEKEREAQKAKRNQEKQQEETPDVRVTVEIDDTGRAKVVKKNK